MTVLVIGGTGNVGSQVVSQLLERDASVRVLTRSAEKARALPAGVEAVQGDLLDPATLRSAFEGADAVFIINPVGPTEAHEGLMAVNGARLAGTKKIVYVSVHNVDKAPYLPHFGAKLPVEIAIEQSGIPYTILRPNNFYQNDYWLKDALLQYGVYAQPIGDRGLSRVDVLDIAEAAAIALTTSAHDGQTYNLVGPEVLTGTRCAEIWSRALGKPIAYAGNDLEAWEQQSLQYMSPVLVFDFKLMYAFFQEDGLTATEEDLARQAELLGHAPRTFEDFTAAAAAAWR